MLFRLIGCMLVMFAFVAPVMAIDDVTNVKSLELGQIYTLDDGSLSFSYPDNWVTLEGHGVVIVASRPEVLETNGPNDLEPGDVIFFLYPSVRYLPNYPQHAGLAQAKPDGVVAFYSTIGSRIGYTEEGAMAAPVIGDGKRQASRSMALAPEDAHERQVIAMENGSGDIVTLFVFTKAGEMSDVNATIEAILASVQLDSI